MLVPLAVAYLLTSRHLWGSSVFRVLFYLPAIVPFVASAFVWDGFFNDTTGWLNRMLRAIGLDPPDWINDKTWVIPALGLIALWGIGNAIIIYMASLRSVPVDLFEAARIDGANAWKTFRHVTWPMISPVTFYNLVIVLVALGQYFIVPFVLTDGTGKSGRCVALLHDVLLPADVHDLRRRVRVDAGVGDVHRHHVGDRVRVLVGPLLGPLPVREEALRWRSSHHRSRPRFPRPGAGAASAWRVPRPRQADAAVPRQGHRHACSPSSSS